MNNNIDNKIYLCAISNIASGICNEDCKFCTQSIKYKSKIERFYRKDISNIVKEAENAIKNRAVGFCLVTANGAMDDKILEFVCQTATEIRKKVGDQISLIACNGTATVEQLKEIKKVGIKNYNHNLETSKEFYNQICTTHSWEDRFNTCLNVKEVDLNLCVGGIFGLGETNQDRISMLNSIKELKPLSVPINFYHPNSSLPLKQNIMDKEEAFKLIELTREILPDVMLMIAGGRELVFGNNQYDIFKYGANSIIIGDYLTTKGKTVLDDIKNIKEMGFTISDKC